MDYFDIRRSPDIVTIQTENGFTRAQKKDAESWQSGDIEVTTVLGNEKQHVYLAAPQSAVKRIALRWQLRIPAYLRYLGDHWERGYGDLGWQTLVPERILPWYFLASNGDVTHGYGVKTGGNAFSFWQVDTQGVTLWLDVRNGGSGVLLGERVLEAAVIISREGQEGESSFQAARAFCRLLCDTPGLPAQPVYGGNNWYYAYGKSSHNEILEDSRLIANLAPAGDNRPFMVIDDGWQICQFATCNGGPWHQGNYAFPDMEKLTQEMCEIGVRPGLWFRPMLTMLKVPQTWLLAPARDVNYNVGVVLDPSVKDVLQHVQDDVRRMAKWGFELIKHDFSTYDLLGKWGMQMGAAVTDDGWHFADRTRTTAEIIGTFYRAIAEAAGEDALVIGCNTVGHLGAGLFEIQRTGDDTSGREWERTRKMGVNTLAFRMPQHETFFAADADCVGLTTQIPWELNRRWLDLVARSGTPLFVSASPDAVGPEQERALREAFAIAAQQQPAAEPLDWQENTCPANWLIDGEVVHFNWYEAEGIKFF